MKDAEQLDGDEGKSFLSRGDFYWPGVWIGFSLSLVVTLAAGIPLLVVFDNSWLLAVTSIASLFAAAFIAARRGRTSEPLNGALIVLLHFFTLALVFLVGQALAVLPEPLPGLDASDSTFYFSWPLLQMVFGTLGSLLGGLGSNREQSGVSDRASASGGDRD